MAASMYLNDDERFDLPIRFPVGSGESAYSVTGVGSQRVTALQHGSWSQHDTHLEIPPPSEHHANNEPPPVHSHAYSSQGLLLQHADSSGNRLLSANSQHGLQVADANTPGEPVSPSSAPLFSIPNKLQCEQCPVLFNGNDRKSNLARHVRNKHTLANVRTFRCTGCNKVCGRKDALLKHERKCQPGLHSDPVKRKKDKKATATTPSRKANNRFSPRRPPAKMPAPTNVASAPQTPRTHAPTVFATQASFTVPDLQQPPGMGPLALDFSNIHTSAHTDHEPSVANVWGVGNWVPTPSGPSDPAAGEDQAFKQLHYAMQQAVEAVPSHQAADPFLYLGQHGLAPYNAAQQEGWPSPQHLHPPYPAQGYRRPLSPTNVSVCLESTDLSTLPSNNVFDAASSSYFPPTYPYNGPTSVHGSVDPAHRSPLASPISFHSTSLHSAASPYGTHHNIPSAQGSPPGHHCQAIPNSDASFIYSQEDEDLLTDLFTWSPPL